MLLSEAELEFVEEIGLAFEPQGLSRTAGRVLGCLLLADPPYQSSHQLAETLGVSKASISTQTRLLLASGLIERVGVPGARGDHFQLASRGWGELLRLHTDKMAKVRCAIERGLALAQAHGEAARERMKNMHTFFLFAEQELSSLLTHWNSTSTSRMELARQSNQPGSWITCTDPVSDWSVSFVDLEEVATRVRTFQMQFIPGPLQTPSYARAVISRGNPWAASASIERHVALQMARAELLARPGPPKLWAVVDEAALRRNVGGAAVMRAQLTHLLNAAKLPSVTIQVMPFAHGNHAAESGTFSLLRFPQPDHPDLVYLTQLTGAFYLAERRHVDIYTQAIDQLAAEAVSPQASIGLITKILERT